MKIGVFDSGLGGLSVLHCAQKLIPNADYVYYADEKHVPYGEKKPEELKGFIKEIIQFMIDKNVDAIVIACNTATSMIDKSERKKYPIPIVGMEPAVKKAVDLYSNENKRILVAATPVTITGDKLKGLVEQVDRDNMTDLVALPGLVRYAEQGDFSSDGIITYLKEALKEYDLSNYGTVVLGCTHFNYFKPSFQKLFDQEVHFLDGNEGTIHQLLRVLPNKLEKKEKGTVEYYFSGDKLTEKEHSFVQQCLSQLDVVYSIN
ncbi:MAG: glutamate racemase [Clostridiales bacterium]|nr:glutamate racemase [Clostridiales bacterium]